MNVETRSSENAKPERAGESELDFKALARAVLGYWWLVLLCVGVIGGLVTVWTLRQPRVYQATCVIEYDPQTSSPLGSQVEDVSSAIGAFWMSREFFQTQNRIIASRTVAERVVRELRLHGDPSFFNVPDGEHASFQERSVDEAATVLQGRLLVEPVPDTRLVHIKVSDRSPARAATLANAVAQAYIDKTLEDRMGSTVSAVEWLDGRLRTLQDQLGDSEQELHAFKERHNILSVSMESRQNLVANDIEHFNAALTKARNRRIELAARLARVRSAAQVPNAEDAAAAFPDNPTIATLRQALRTKLAEREGLATRYGPNHTRMQELDGHIGDLRRQLQVEVQGVVRAAEADLREVRQVESGLRSELDDAHHAGLELNLREIEYSSLNRRRENNAKLYGMVLERSTETNLTQMYRSTHVRLLDRALRPRFPVSPNHTANAAAGVGAGLAFGLLLALALSQLDRRLKSVEDIEIMGVTVLGVVPRIEEGSTPAPVYGGKRPKRRRGREKPEDQSRDTYVHAHPMSAAAECCRTIRTNLTFMSADAPIRTLVVTSPSPREGKTTVTTNVAISLAQSGKRVLVIDTDLRRPRVHRAFGVSGARGFTSVIVGEERLEEVTIPTDVPNLDVLPCGPIPPNPSELFHSHRFLELVAEAKERYDRIIFDSPPLGAVTDAAVLAPQLDACLIVVKAQDTTRDALRSALRQLHDVGANVVGAVLNGIDPRRKGYASGAGYYYYYRREGYYSTEDDSGDDPPAQAGDRSAASPP
ncbi:MAG: polysaccharide biosynthesis tyrosine autokinase [Sandaracinaceae bacterium]|nr:polysaccharide biosynthesis tyrosine autokinase [Sandaracinaceae bacterium]